MGCLLRRHVTTRRTVGGNLGNVLSQSLLQYTDPASASCFELRLVENLLWLMELGICKGSACLGAEDTFDEDEFDTSPLFQTWLASSRTAHVNSNSCRIRNPKRRSME
ncbi:hypothetical protein E4U53_005395 [Claviceps sorghi]|nr:hypothetical protein E4U53_005395 [Claviceps sorghi]